MILFYYLTPQVGLEPTTNRLTVDSSTTELLRIFNNLYLPTIIYHIKCFKLILMNIFFDHNKSM